MRRNFLKIDCHSEEGTTEESPEKEQFWRANCSRDSNIKKSTRNIRAPGLVVNVIDKLKANLNGSGDLTYSGSPGMVDVDARGSGEVYKK